MAIYLQDMLVDFTSFLIKPLVRVISEHNDRSMKGILSEPTRRFPHTRVSSSIHLSPAIVGIKPKVLDCTQQDLPDRRKKKTPRICKAYLDCWFIAFAGSITNSASLYSKFLAVVFSYLANHSR